MKTYEVIKPITVPPGAGFTYADGKEVGAAIVSTGTICADPEHSATISLVENGCIKEPAAVKSLANKVISKGRGR